MRALDTSRPGSAPRAAPEWAAVADLDVRVDASTGQIYPDAQVSNLSKHDVEAALSTQGYTHVHDVDFDDGIWKAKADNPAGKKVKLRIDAHSGKVIGID